MPLCPPLHYPSVFARGGTSLGQLTLYRQFAVTSEDVPGSNVTWSLRRCASNLDLDIGDETDAYAPVASSRAVVMTRDGFTFHGWFLPSLRRFTIRLPTVLRGDVNLLAVTDRTLYIGNFTRCQIWLRPCRHPTTAHATKLPIRDADRRDDRAATVSRGAAQASLMSPDEQTAADCCTRFGGGQGGSLFRSGGHLMSTATPSRASSTACAWRSW